MELEYDQEKRRASKKITMIYAGQSLADNPAHYACGRLQEVFQELGWTVDYYDLQKSQEEEVISAITECAGVVIALTVEWYGIGYRLQKLLDECYWQKKRNAFTGIPLLAVVFSRDGFEREAAFSLENAWQILGGSQGLQITAMFAGSADLAADFEAVQAIEKKAEQFFRYCLLQNYHLPSSMERGTCRSGELPSVEKDLSPASTMTEKERLEQEKERENIRILSDKLKIKLEEKTKSGRLGLPELFMEKYGGYTDREYRMQIYVTDKPEVNTVVLIKKSGIFAMFGQEDTPVTISAKEETMRSILAGKMSFQRAFMTGELTAKGELTILYKLDDLFENKN